MKKVIIFLVSLVILSSFVSADISDLTNLLGYYNMEKNASDIHDNRAGITVGVTNRSGCLIGDCLSFDGNDYIDLTSHYNGVFDVFTISMWVNYTSASAMDFWSGGNNVGPNFIQFSVPSTNLRFQYVTGVGDNEIDTTQGTPRSGTWRHLVGVYNGTHKAIWIDGKLNASTASSTTGDNAATDTEIGKRVSGTNYFTGQMDEVGFWNRSLTPTEILALYNNGAGLAYPFVSGGDTDPPSISNLNCTSCIEDSTPNQPPYITEDTTPTFNFSTDENAWCAIGISDVNYTIMGASRNCTSGEGAESHICTLTTQDKFANTGTNYLYISCKDNSGNEGNVSDHSKSNSGPIWMEIQGVGEIGGDDAMVLGITTSEIGGTATIYTAQRASARNLANNQFTVIFDKVASNGNKRWAFNYVSSGESQITGLFNLTPVLYVLQLQNQTNETITDQVGKLINGTWP